MIDLIKELQENDNSKKKLFIPSTMSMGYPTRLTPVLDYILGYNVHVYDGDKYVRSYPSLGIKDGSMVMIVGKSSTAKTTMAIQIAANIVRKYKNGVVIHFDIERAMNYSRVSTLTRFPMPLIESGKYILRREHTTIQDIKLTVTQIYLEKTRNPEKYIVHENLKNEFNRDIDILAPTVIVADSIASLLTELNENTKEGQKKMEEVSTQTERMRLAGEIGRMFNEIMPMMSAANIILISINHIHARGQIGIIPQPPELMFLNQDEALPGGKNPPYLANTLIKNTAIGSEKFTEEEHGYSGFGIRVKVVKSRSNANNREVDMIFNTSRGVDYLRTTVNFAEKLGLVGGDKRGKYFLDHKEIKWKPATIYNDFAEHKELGDMLYDMIGPTLQSFLQEPEPAESDDDVELQYRY